MATVDALKNKKDIELMKAVLKERNPRYYLLFVIGTNTGLRIGDFYNQYNKELQKALRKAESVHLQEIEQTCTS